MKRVVFAVLLFMLVASAWDHKITLANNDSIWVNESALVIEQDDDPESITTYGNYVSKNCYEAVAKVQRYQKFIGDKWTNPVIQEVSACATQTPLGIVYTRNGPYVQFPGDKYAQRLVDAGGKGLGVTPIPNNRALLISRSGYGSQFPQKFYIFYSVNGVGESVVASNGERVFSVNSYPQEFLDEEGNNLQLSDVAFSKNGEWMVAKAKDVLIRLNVTMKSIQTFSKAYSAAGLNYSLGVSNDGRYVFEQINQFFQGGNAFVYDLSGCEPNSSFTLESGIVAGCERKDIRQHLIDSIDGFRFLSGVNFSNNGELIKAVARYKKLTDANTPSGVAIVSMYNQGYILPEVGYLALGDSFASGEGENQGGDWYELGTDEEQNLCHLSRRSYPYLIAQTLGLNGFNETPTENSAFHSVACSGARISNIIGGFGVSRDKQDLNRDNQFDDIPENNSLSSWIPGHLRQVDFLIRATPSFLTLSIGGNNVGFSTKLMECISPLSGLTCKYADDPDEKTKVAAEIANQYQKLTDAYKQIALSSENKSKIYIIGYPQFINPDPDANCAINVRLNSKEREFVYEATAYMNNVIEAAAKSAGVYYVDIESSLFGYNLCSQTADSDVTVNGVTEGNDKHLPWYAGYLVGGLPGVVASQRLGIANESFHPNDKGHHRMKNSILSALGNDPSFFDVCPQEPGKIICPNTTNIPLPSAYFGESATQYVDVLNGSSTPLPSFIAPTFYPIVYRGESVQQPRDIKIVLDILKPNSNAEIIIKSTPTSLGSFQVNSSGVLDLSLSLPESLPAGFHSIHVIGTSLSGEAVNYYEGIFVPGPEGDINDNSIPDSDELCGFSEPSGLDNDKDGIDDACDGYIGEPPEEDSSDKNGNKPSSILEHVLSKATKALSNSKKGSHLLEVLTRALSRP